MPLITLTTDFGLKDHFVGVIKGAIYSQLPKVRIIDISHQISPYNVIETAYILKSSYHRFPKGTIHIIGVDSEWRETNKHIALELDGHFFVCPNNGLISMITSEVRPKHAVEIENNENNQSSFAMLDVFVDVACKILRKQNLSGIGKELGEIKYLREIKPKIEKTEVKQNGKIQLKTQIKGSVIYIDNYGNVVTNITRKLFEEHCKNSNYTILAAHAKFKKIYDSYNGIIPSDAISLRKYDGNKLAMFNSEGHLEIVIFRSDLGNVGGASTLLGLDPSSSVVIEF